MQFEFRFVRRELTYLHVRINDKPVLVSKFPAVDVKPWTVELKNPSYGPSADEIVSSKPQYGAGAKPKAAFSSEAAADLANFHGLDVGVSVKPAHYGAVLRVTHQYMAMHDLNAEECATGFLGVDIDMSLFSIVVCPCPHIMAIDIRITSTTPHPALYDLAEGQVLPMTTLNTNVGKVL